MQSSPTAASALPTIKIFRAGSFTSAEGENVSFDSADMADIAASYDAKKDPAPIVIGHPKMDHPAYGWIGKLTYDGEHLVAQPSEMVPEMIDAVRSGSYRKVSAAFYPPRHPSNPAPGHYYLKHVGFLGASPPAVKGLGTVSFSESVGTPAVTIIAPRPASSVLGRALELQARSPGMSLHVAREQAGREMSLISLAEQATDPITAAKVAMVARAAQLQTATPSLSFGEAMATARKESILADLAEQAAHQR